MDPAFSELLNNKYAKEYEAFRHNLVCVGGIEEIFGARIAGYRLCRGVGVVLVRLLGC